MSQQHAQFEEEAHGEPSYQIGYSTRDDLPPLSYDHADMPGQKLQAGSRGATRSTTRFVLALLSLIFVFVLVVLVITLAASFIDFLFVLLFAALAILLNLIFAYGGNASPRSASQPED